MRRVIFISILLTICTVGWAQEAVLPEPVRLVFTANFQQHPFGQDPVWGGWSEGSMARAVSYIRSHRRSMGEDHFAHIHVGNLPLFPYTVYPENFGPRILDYADTEHCSFERNGISFALTAASAETRNRAWSTSEKQVGLYLTADPTMTLEKIARLPKTEEVVVAAFGREPEVCRVLNLNGDTVTVLNLGTSGRYIGVADIYSRSRFTVKTVDISGFPADAEYTEHFQPLYDSLRTFFTTSLTTFTDTLRQADTWYGSSTYTALFHRFQSEITKTAISFFAAPRRGDVIPAGPFTPVDLIRRFPYANQLVVIELTGKEIRDYLEYAYGLRYNTMRQSTDNLLRMTRDRDGVLQLRTSVYNLDEAAGIDYRVDVSKPQGRRVQVTGLSDGSPFRMEDSYQVVVNSHRLSGDNCYLSRATGLSAEELEHRIIRTTFTDFRELFWGWLSRQGNICLENPGNWQAIPESFIEAAAGRINE